MGGDCRKYFLPHGHVYLVPPLRVKQIEIFSVRKLSYQAVFLSGAERTAQEKDFELILTLKIETRHPVDVSLAANFRRFVIIAEL